MPRWVTTLVKHPQHQHIKPRDVVIHGMAGAIATPDVFFHETEITPHVWVACKAVEMIHQALVVTFGLSFTELLKGIHININKILLCILAQEKAHSPSFARA